MLSSTYKELTEHRRAVQDAMLGQRLLPIAMENDAALPDKDLIAASLAKVDEADAYVGLISYRYGQTPVCQERNPDQLSLTELEFRRALARGIPICMFIMHDDHPVPRRAVGEERGAEQKLASFLQLAKKDRIYAEFKSVDDLKAKVIQSLIELRGVLEQMPEAGSSGDVTKTRHALTNIPISVPHHFLGRDDDLAAISDIFARDKARVTITTLRGMRGVGKTTLAAAYAERHRADYRATWWIRAQTESTMRADLVGLGARFGWVAVDEKEESALAAVMERLRLEGEGVLLIYDNAPDAAALHDYLPRGGTARVLVTSNAHAWRGVAEPVEIRLWPKEIGAEYLIARTGRAAERAAAEVLSDALGGLPLAHEQAAAYCERLEISLAEYHKRFEATPARMLDSARDAPAEYHDRLTVTKTFALAIDEAAKLHPAAEPLIVHAALLASEPIPLFLFSEAREKFGAPLAAALEGDGLDEAVAALRAFALVDREPIPDERDAAITTDCIRLHRLVRQVAAARCEGEAREAVRCALIEAVAAIYPSNVFSDPKAWPPARRLDALALALVGVNAEPSGESENCAAKLLDRLASYRQAALAAYAQARPLFERALAIREKVLGPEDTATATSLNNLAGLLHDQGDLVGAQPLFERALAIYEKVLGPEHPDTAGSLSNLAYLLQSQGDLAWARPLFERALTTKEKLLGPEHPETAKSLNNLAALLWNQGDLAGARPLYERALAIREKVRGPEHPETATSLNNLALLLLAQHDFAGARPLLERALAIREKVLGPEHPHTADSLIGLASLLQAEGDLAGARPLYERTLAICERALGTEHPITNHGRMLFAHLPLARGSAMEALALGETALAAHDRVLGQDHPWTKDSARVTATALDALGRAAEAASLRERYGLISSSQP
jgi:tetratricopeptide (TPR) repeat protein